MGRVHHTETIALPRSSDGALLPAAGVGLSVKIVNEDGSEGASYTPFTGRTGAATKTSMVTDAQGNIDFWLDAGDYNIHYSDTQTPARFAAYVRGRSSTPGGPNGLIVSQLPEYGRGLWSPGDLKPSATPLGSPATDPAGWLLCDGRTVARSAYAALFNALGTAWNTGGEAGTDFRIPDFRGRYPHGADNFGTGRGAAGRFSKPGIAYTGGEENHTLSNGEMPTHSHGGNTGDDSTTHTHDFSSATVLDLSGGFSVIGSGGQGVGTLTSTGGPTPVHHHGIANDGGGTSHNNMPPYGSVNWLIKT